MLQIAGGIILAVIILYVALILLGLAFSGFQKNAWTGCVTTIIFGGALITLATCVFGG